VAQTSPNKNPRSIPKSTRFEVFKRDGFTCQYCGKKAPDVILHVDHIHPVSKGGGREVVNLITSCVDCNTGKGARTLDDDAVIKKQQRQLEELNERREQFEMQKQWRDELQDIAEREADEIQRRVEDICDLPVTPTGRADIKKWLKTFSWVELVDAVDQSFERYLEFGANGEVENLSAHKAFNSIPIFARMARRPEGDKKLYYIRGILRNRINLPPQSVCLAELKRAREAGVSVDFMMALAKEAADWDLFMDHIAESLRAQQEPQDA
jgi:hypothetical protein